MVKTGSAVYGNAERRISVQFLGPYDREKLTALVKVEIGDFEDMKYFHALSLIVNSKFVLVMQIVTDKLHKASKLKASISSKRLLISTLVVCRQTSPL